MRLIRLMELMGRMRNDMIIDEDESCRFVIKFIVCWLSVIFWGGGGLFLGVTTLYKTKKRIPYLIIYDDRVEQ